MIPDGLKALIVSKIDLVQLIGKDITLKRSGASYKAHCPFHRDQTPSFFVVPRLNHYKCHSCGRYGDSIDWLVEFHRQDWREAVFTLAEMVGVSIPESDEKDSRAFQELMARQKEASSVMRIAQAYFHEALLSNQAALDYLRGRGVSLEVVKASGLGYAPERYQIEGLTSRSAVMAGLAKTENGKARWLFRDRIMFPIWDRQKRLSAFGGRRMGERGPKYINSQESVLYKKRETLGGFGRIVPGGKRVALVEGYMDELILNSNGIPALSTCGSALSDEQARLLLSRFPDVSLIFDGDQAGLRAILSAAEVIFPHLSPRNHINVVLMPTGKDPDELLLEEGPSAFQGRMEASTDLIDYLFDLPVPGTTAKATHLDWLKRLHSKMPSGMLKELLSERFTQAGIKVEPERQQKKGARVDVGYYTLDPGMRMAAILLAYPDLVRKSHVVPAFLPEPAKSIACKLLEQRNLNAAGISRLLTDEQRIIAEPLLTMDFDGVLGIDIENAYLLCASEEVKQLFLETKDPHWFEVHSTLSRRLGDIEAGVANTPIQCLVDGVEDKTAFMPDMDEEEEFNDEQ